MYYENKIKVVWVSAYLDANGEPIRRNPLDDIIKSPHPKPRLVPNLIWASPYLNWEGYAGPSILDKYIKRDTSLYEGYKTRSPIKKSDGGRGRDRSDGLYENCSNTNGALDLSTELNARYAEQAAQALREQEQFQQRLWIDRCHGMDR